MNRFIIILEKVLFVIPLFIILAVIIMNVFNKSLTIFPHPVYEKRISKYADDELGGNSRIIDFSVLENKIVLTYTLGKNHTTSFAGIFFDLSILDVSAYNYLEIQLDVTSPVHYLVTFMAFIEGQTRISELNTIANYSKEIELKKGSRIYRINLQDLKNKTGRMNLLFLHLKELIIAGKSKTTTESFYTTKTIIIEKISFRRSYTSIAAISILIIIIIDYAFFALLYLSRKKNKRLVIMHKEQKLPAARLNIETYREQDTKKILDHVREHTFEPGFSIHTVNHFTGLSELKISRLIEAEYNLSFKQLINQIRLNEAKRLLLESDLKVYDIAYKIGYNDNTYFCKLFKKHFGLTPVEWRKRNDKQT